MIKFALLALVLANGLLFAYHQGRLESLFPSGREPARLSRQLNADKIRVIRPDRAEPGARTPAAPAAIEPVAMKDEQAESARDAVCIEVAAFNPTEARRFEAALAESSIEATATRRELQATSSHMVWIPSLPDKDAAARKAAELQRLGVDDFYIIQDDTPQRWGISLGVFRTEDAARAHLNSLGQQGIRSARLMAHKVPLKKVAFQLQDLAPATQTRLTKVLAAFPTKQAAACQ